MPETPSVKKLRQKTAEPFEASLDFIVSTRPIVAIQQDLVSKNIYEFYLFPHYLENTFLVSVIKPT